ncbi:MAG: hypothetical protein EOP06_14110 [Proteobacteria bacterium]|nr:MAG: hypothetical protein EOP06_14110 [Pseudomonadota bacterium]
MESTVHAVSKISGRSKLWLLLMLSTGFCSMIYELALAQLLTGLLGNALARFATTLGVYVVGMGLGSVTFSSKDEARDGRTLFIAEIGLFITGLVAPFIFVGAYRFALDASSNADTQTWIVLVITHSVIFLTGLLSGLELPILSAISNRDSGQGDSTVLTADYVGMFLASIAFPFLLYPVIGLIPTFAIATALNLGAAALTFFLIGGKSSLVKILLVIFAALNLVSFVFASHIQTWLSNLYAVVS